MRYRGRLTLFFLLIVVLPMIAVAVLVVHVTAQSRNGKADARLTEAIDTVTALYRDDSGAAKRATKRLGQDPSFGAALSSGDSGQIRSAARSLAGGYGIDALVVRDASGHKLVTLGRSPLVASYRLDLRGSGGDLASLLASTTTPAEYLAEVRRLTGLDGALTHGGKHGSIHPSGR